MTRHLLFFMLLVLGSTQLMATRYEVKVSTDADTVQPLHQWLSELNTAIDWQRRGTDVSLRLESQQATLDLVEELILKLGKASDYFQQTKMDHSGVIEIQPLYKLIQQKQLKFVLSVNMIESQPIGIEFKKRVLAEATLPTWFLQPSQTVDVAAIADLARAEIVALSHLGELEKYGQLDVWLWRLWNRGDRQRLGPVLVKVAQSYPNYSPPEELIRLLNQPVITRIQRAILEAIDSQNDKQLLALYSSHPRAFNCGFIQSLWGLAEAVVRQKGGDRSFPVYLQIIVTCQSASQRIDTLYKAKSALPLEYIWSLVEMERANARPMKQALRFQQFISELQRESLQQALALNDVPSALDIIKVLSPQVMKQQDVLSANQFAWIYFDLKAYGHAEVWFQRVLEWESQNQSAAEGHLLILLYQEKFDEALAWVEQRQTWMTGVDDLIRNIYLRAAWTALREEQFSKVERLLKNCSSCVHNGIEELHIRALLLYKTGKNSQEVFAILYRVAPTDAVEKSYAAALEGGGQWELLAQLSARHNGAFTEAYHRHLAALAYADGLLLLKNDYDSYSPIVTEDYSGFWGLAGLSGRVRKGERDLDYLNLKWLPHVQARMTHERQELRVWVNQVQMRTKRPHGDFPFGHYLLSTPGFSPKHEVDHGLEPALLWSLEGPHSWRLFISRTPTDGAISSEWLARVSWQARIDPLKGKLGVDLFRDSVRDSVLSYVGMQDIYTGLSWGQVLRQGVEVHYTSSGLTNSISADLTLESLKGEHVRHNDHWQLTLVQAYDRTHENESHRVFGPMLQLEQYDKNLNYYTWGHGGYFSPQSRVALGVFADWLSQQGSIWLAHLKADLSLAYTEQDKAPCYAKSPVVNTANRCVFEYNGETEFGPAGSLEAHAARQLSPHWTVGGGARYARAEEWEELSYHLFLRFNMSPRYRLYQPDLEEFSFNRL